MNADDLRTLQKPLKEKYQTDPASAVITMHATGQVSVGNLSCCVPTPIGSIEVGLHPAAGGDIGWGCSGDMLLQSLVACAGVTFSAVATAMGIAIRKASITAEADIDFRGTLGLSKEVPIGVKSVRMNFQIDSDAAPEQLAKLVQLTERYCVIFQTLKHPPEIAVTVNAMV